MLRFNDSTEMLSGIDFLKMACPSDEPHGFKFDPFGDEDPYVNSPDFSSLLGFLDVGNDPRPAPKPGVKLQHPRPQRSVALVDALERLEKMAWSTEFVQDTGKGGSTPNSDSRMPTVSPRRPNPLALSPDEHSTLPASRRVVEPPKRLAGQQQQPPSPGRACLSPGFLDHFPELSASQARWPRAPRPEELSPPTFSLAKARALGNICFYPPSPPQPKLAAGRASEGLACLSPGFLDHFPQQGDWGRAQRLQEPPRPTFVLPKVSARKGTPIPSPIPTIPSQYTGESKVEEEELQKNNDAKGYVELAYASDEEEEEEEEDINSSFESMFEYRSVILEEDDEEYYTASEYSGYEADDDSFDEEAVVPPASACASPSPSCAFVPSPYSSAGSLAYTTSTSPTDSFLSINSGASHTQAALSVNDTNPVNPVQQLRWTVGMPGDAVSFLIAAERALQKQAQVQRQWV